MFNIVLLEPEIPANTGNIGRTCLVTGSRLHLIEPMGFIINDKNLKRAGMDYWADLDVTIYDSWRDFLQKNADNININSPLLPGTNPSGANVWMATTKAPVTHSDVSYKDGDYIMFGKESAGIPEEILVDNKKSCLRIPMMPAQRSLNLSNSVAVVLYEALRQNNYLSLETEGALHYSSWKE
ncbi:MAG: tRNA (cytidine(34)-2'-O)-methyltransferase [Parasporobacterium sp.]|nr:tRNA (cytidine(34)-2'-O)-methyltransferase [Parasporobacterium sp.]